MPRVVRSRGRVVDDGMRMAPARRVRRTVVDDGPHVDAVDDVVVDDAVERRAVWSTPWSPAQIVALSIGAIFTLLGAVALARTGLDFRDVTANHVVVAGFRHTALLALIELVLGLFLIGIGAMPGAERGGMVFFGVMLFGFGVVIAAEPDAFFRYLGTQGGHGVLYIISGVLLLVTAMAAPVFFADTRRAVNRRVDVYERETY